MKLPSKFLELLPRRVFISDRGTSRPAPRPRAQPSRKKLRLPRALEAAAVWAVPRSLAAAVCRIFAVVLVLSAGLFLTGCKQEQPPAATGPKTLYTCGMHPQVVQD